MDIKKVIKAHGYTLEKVCAEWKDKDGTSRPITKGSLSGSINNNPTVETLRQIATIVGCDMSDFFLDEKKDNKDGDVFLCPHCNKPIKVVK